MTKVKYPIVAMVVFIWIGFVCAISFMEAWLKFQAPGMTVVLAMGIGKLVFNAMNKVECFFAIVIIANAFLMKEEILPVYILFLIPGIILIIQSTWLLPGLSFQAQMLMEGKDPPPSNLHLYYVSSEIVKVFCLLIFGVKLFK